MIKLMWAMFVMEIIVVRYEKLKKFGTRYEYGVG